MSTDAIIYGSLWEDGIKCDRRFGEMKLQYTVKLGVVIVHIFDGNAVKSGSFWNDVRTEMSDFIQKGFIFDATEIQNSYWGKIFMEKISTAGGKLISKKRCFQTGLIENTPYQSFPQVAPRINNILTQV